MTWVKLDDQFPDHPKVAQVGPLASWLHVCALAYCNRYLTDGFVPEGQVAKLADFSGIECGSIEVGPFYLAARLVDFDLWEEVENGFLIHNYLLYQPSREQVERDRQQRVEAGRKGGLAKAKRPADQIPSDPPSGSSSKTEAKLCPVPDPVPLVNQVSSSTHVGRWSKDEISSASEVLADHRIAWVQEQGTTIGNMTRYRASTVAGAASEIREWVEVHPHATVDQAVEALTPKRAQNPGPYADQAAAQAATLARGPCPNPECAGGMVFQENVAFPCDECNSAAAEKWAG